MATIRVDFEEVISVTKTKSIMASILMTAFRRCILLVVLACSTVLSAQGVAQTGTLEEMHQADGYMTISGRNYDFKHSVTEVYYDGKKVRAHFLNEGLVVRFVVNRDGVLARIEILGPINLIEALEES